MKMTQYLLCNLIECVRVSKVKRVIRITGSTGFLVVVMMGLRSIENIGLLAYNRCRI